MKILMDNFEILLIHEIEDVTNDNIDIVVTYEEQEYTATVFTLNNIKTLMERFEQTGESGKGLYFSCYDMLIVKDLKKSTIINTISNIINEGKIGLVLKKISRHE